MPPRNSIRCQIILQNEGQTVSFGKELGRLLRPGLVIALIGDLGAGKTRLTQAIVSDVAGEEVAVTSPTFVLIHEYVGRMTIYHFDAYRLRDIDEFLDLGIEELFHGDNVCIVEWADKVSEAFTGDVLWIKIEVNGPESRAIELVGTGEISKSIVHAIAPTSAGG